MAAARATALAFAVVACAGCGGHRGAATCRGADIRLSTSSPFGEATGQHTVGVTLRNAGDAACSLDGFPTVALLNARGHELPFKYSHGGDQMVGAIRPRRVTLRRGGTAAVVLNKYRCDLRALDRVASVRLVLPGDSATEVVPLTPEVGILDYCREQPSLTVAVSPVVAAFGQAAAHG